MSDIPPIPGQPRRVQPNDGSVIQPALATPATQPVAPPLAQPVAPSTPTVASEAESKGSVFGQVYEDLDSVPAPILRDGQKPVVGVDDYSSSYAFDMGAGENLPQSVRLAAQALLDLIADDQCSEVLMNGPKEIAKKVAGARYQVPEIAFDSADIYHKVINEVILSHCVDTDDRIDNQTVIIEGQLELPSPTPGRAPMLARVHIIAPPGVAFAKVTIAKKPRIDLSLDDLANNGTMSQAMADFLKAAALGRQTIVVSGPSGSGKTTLLQALTHHFDHNDRVIVIEETPELRLTLGDVVYLHATPDRPGQDMDEAFSLEVWTKQANRMRADRIIVGEIRGSEMSEFLVAANSGAEGSATTVHANTPRRALDKILTLATKSLTSTSEPQLRREIAATVDLIVQVGLVEGRHIVTDIEEISDTVAQSTGQIASNPLFGYDKIAGVHVAKGQPSEDMVNSMSSHGVPLQYEWFRKQG